MEETEQPVKPKGWFVLEGHEAQEGDRTLKQQLKGLVPLFKECVGKSILDVGCAEGLISIQLAKAGARAVRGIEIVDRYIPIAQRLAKHLPCKFVCSNADDYVPAKRYDIVIALALLHKLRDPTAACMKYANACRDLMVIRLPPGRGETISDERTGFEVHDIGACMREAGFALERTELGPFEEPTFYYRRA